MRDELRKSIFDDLQDDHLDPAGKADSGMNSQFPAFIPDWLNLCCEAFRWVL